MRGRRLTLRSTEVDDVSVLLEHVHLLNASEGLNSQLLHSGLQLGVITTGHGTLGLLHNLSAWGTLATNTLGALQLSKLLLINRHLKLL